MRNFSKNLLFSVLTLILAKSSLASAAAGLTEDDTRLRFLGRTLGDAATGSVTLDWTASGVEFSFNGTEVAADMVGTTADPRNVAYLAVFVDDVHKNTFMVDNSPKKYILCSGLPATKHLVRIVKVSEAQLSSVKLTRIHLNGELLAKPAAKSRKIEFIGDSITCGYGNLGGATDPFSSKTEDGLQTWATIAARNLEADCQLICASGHGVVRDCNRDTRALIPPLYEKSNPFSDTNQLWDFSLFPADAVVINLGTNDWAGGAPEDEFIAGAVKFIKEVRKHNPNAKIIWAYGLMVKQYAEFIEKAVKEAQADDGKIYFVPMTLQNAVDGIGPQGHPSVKTHEKAGGEFASVLKDIMGW